mmetsp:Transcript_7834/g.7406  ORF Transcript_7834/g.7406 Transcript_7834/m.7406 type:complete len:142 (-) Transcript_7834:219-644(-)
MQGNFMKVKKFLEDTFPELNVNGSVTGSNYPAPPLALLIANVLSYVQIFIVAVFMFGDSIWSYVPFVQSPPEFYHALKRNPIPVLFGIFLILPSIIQSHIATGAFEIALDGNVIFSKLESGRFPDANDLISGFVKAGLTKS